MKEKVLSALYSQLVFHSENGISEIEHPWFAISEACKCSGASREEVREAFYAFEKQNVIRVVDDGKKMVCYLTEAGTNEMVVTEVIRSLCTPK